MRDDPTALTLHQLAAAYRSGELRPSEVAEAYLDRLQPGPVYRVVTAERALRQARRADRWFDGGIDLGPLQGIPLALKDLMDTEGEVTAAGSRVLEGNPPAAQDCPAAARLDAAGAVFLGKTTMTELAFSGIGINPHYGTPGNAADPSRIPGGSSSGSAVAVATGLACVAVGSDTGGSVRIPAALNGVVGLKVSDGRIPLDGCVPLSTTLDTLGPIARTVDDAWSLYLSLAALTVQRLPELPARLSLLAPTTIVRDELDPAVADVFDAACARFEAMGHGVERQTLPLLAEIPDLYARYGSFANHEAIALHGDRVRAAGGAIDPRVAKRILALEGRASVDYIRLGYARTRLRRHFWEQLRQVDAIVAPTVPILPPEIATLEADDDAYVRANGLCLRNTMLFNFLGGPAVSVPVGTSPEGLPVGLMIATAPGQEGLALAIARTLEPRT